MTLKYVLYGLALALAVVILGGIGYVITRPTTSQKADKIENKVYNIDPPKVPIAGCALWRVNLQLYYEKAKSRT